MSARLSRVLSAVFACAVLAGCHSPGVFGSPAATPSVSGSGSASPTATATPTDPVTPSPSASALPDPATEAAYAKFYEQKLSWINLGKTQRARISVPVDWSDPGRGAIQLVLARMPATGKSLGSVFVNPGGPGGSGVDFLTGAGTLFPPRIRASYDLIGFDPRGVGISSPIHCLTDSQLDTFLSTDPNPTTAARIAGVEQQAKSFADACESNVKNEPLLANMGTPSVARDLDVMRAAVGDSTLRYMGYSYGTYIGEIYASLYPTRVGRMVLDGVIDPALTAAGMATGQAAGFQTAYEAFVAECLKSSCSIGTSQDAVTTGITDLLTKSQDNPIRTSAPGRPLNSALATTGILGGLYAKDKWADLRKAITAAEAGDGTQLLAMADSYAERTPDGKYVNNQNEAIYAVNCLDHPGADTPEEIKALVPQLSAVSPVFGPFISWGNLPCDYWPVKPTSRPGPIRAPGAPPILVIGTTRDPATPYKWAQSVAAQLESGVLLSRDGDGHTTFAAKNSCIDGAVTNYMVEGTAPPKDTMC